MIDFSTYSSRPCRPNIVFTCCRPSRIIHIPVPITCISLQGVPAAPNDLLRSHGGVYIAVSGPATGKGTRVIRCKLAAYDHGPPATVRRWGSERRALRDSVRGCRSWWYECHGDPEVPERFGYRSRIRADASQNYAAWSAVSPVSKFQFVSMRLSLPFGSPTHGDDGGV